MSPDWIAVGNTGNTVQISSINYTTNVITLSAPIVRTAGQPVWLYSDSRGLQVLYSVAPDVGAFPFPDNVFVTVETAADGSGSVIGSQNVASGATIAWLRNSADSSNNFLANVAGNWSLSSVTGQVLKPVTLCRLETARCVPFLQVILPVVRESAFWRSEWAAIPEL